MIKCLNEIADNNALSITTQMRHNESHSAKVISTEKKISQINLELTLEFEERERDDLLMKLFSIIDNLKINKKSINFNKYSSATDFEQ